MAWKQMEVRQQRVEFVVRALRKVEPLAELCREFGISRPTGYCWLARYREGGVAAIEERSCRPHESPPKTGAERIEHGSCRISALPRIARKPF